MSTFAPSGYSQPSVEDKLHSLAANFRRERDEAHRRQMTAKERLRLAEQEATAMASTVAGMEKDFKDLQQKMGNEREIQNLMKEVDMLTKEMNFQHAELIDKQEHYKQIQRHQEQTKRQEENARASINKVLVKQRNHINDLLTNTPSMFLLKDDSHQLAKYKQDLAIQMECDVDGRLREKWPRLISDKTEAMLEELGSVQRELDSLEHVIATYKSKFNLSLDDNGVHAQNDAMDCDTPSQVEVVAVDTTDVQPQAAQNGAEQSMEVCASAVPN